MTEHAGVDPGMELEPRGAVAVVTGGAGGIGRSIAKALLGRGATVVLADVEDGALAAAVEDLSSFGTVRGVRTDVSDETSVGALADDVFAEYGRCNYLFLNAGVTSGGGGLPWEQEPNDWRWCFGVNVFGVGIGVQAFVPRMLASSAPGQVIFTSSKDGGVAPIATASVYAASKAAITCFAESVQVNLLSHSDRVRASVFYPSGGLMNTGLFSAARNRPVHLSRVGGGAARPSMSFDQLVARVAAASGSEPVVVDLDALGEFAVDGATQRRFVIARDLDASEALLHERAEAIGRGELPPGHKLAF